MDGFNTAEQKSWGSQLYIPGKQVSTIFNGEYLISDDREAVICTLLGSCIAVCLYDEERGIGAMNHFMLPKARVDQVTNPARYGDSSLEMVIAELLAKGAVFERLRAKVYGGANMLNIPNKYPFNIAINNSQFTLDYLEKKGIPVVAQDLGGNHGRKVLFFLDDYHTEVRPVNTDHNPLVRRPRLEDEPVEPDRDEGEKIAGE